MPAINKIEIKSVNTPHLVAGYASVFDNKDAQGDIILAGAFNQYIAEKVKDIKFLWQHNPHKPIGIIKKLQQDYYGLYVEAELNNFSSLAKEAISLIQQGALNGLSIGFKANKTRYNKKREREIMSLTLFEISIVTFPANSKAQIGWVTKSFCNAPNIDLRLEISNKNISNLTKQLTTKYYE